MDSIFLQYVFIFFMSAIPFFEVFIGIPTAIIVFNFPPVVSLLIAFVGNVLSVLLFLFFGVEIKKIYDRFARKFRKSSQTSRGVPPRIQKTFDRFGVIGVCFFSSILVSSQLGATTMTSFGASKAKVFFWTNLGVFTLAVIMTILSVAATEFVTDLVDIDG